MAVEKVVEQLKKHSKNVTTPEEVAQVKKNALQSSKIGYNLSCCVSNVLHMFIMPNLNPNI